MKKNVFLELKGYISSLEKAFLAQKNILGSITAFCKCSKAFSNAKYMFRYSELGGQVDRRGKSKGLGTDGRG